ncbi:hypothetical protein EDB92DRAFT_1978112 [Lactarius akahatsu]|uniref:Kinase-like protein n=1 Tax=Lactarius akahatsu TaxID=416441 RepID=A0AAD4LI11_9AGAM|nr:hypothetical protein EDB92DRAFT_1978112 [Lactarius akahatsu]
MPSVDLDQSLSLQPSPPSVPSSPKKRRTSRAVLGLSNLLLQRPSNIPVGSDVALPKPPASTRSNSSSTRRRRKPRGESKSITTLSFFEPDSTVHVENTPPSPLMTATQERQTRPPRRQVLRVDAQDGPWTAALPPKTSDAPIWSQRSSTSTFPNLVSGVLTPLSPPFPAPTHNLTLSRTAREIVELDHKLHDAYPSVFRPALPIDSSVLPQPTKRKSVILNTLSRLASPASKSTGARNNAPRPAAASTSSPIPSTLPTPVVSPKAEIADPFFDDLGEVAVGTSTSANPTITGLAAYLTTLSNDQVFRQARPWKRFVRVRTDDLESVRVERAIRRVRSDVAAHLSSPSTVNVTMHNTSVLDDTRRAGTERKSREETLNGNAPGMERRASRFRENIDGAETRQRDDISMHDTDPTPSLVSDGKSNTEDMPERTLTDGHGVMAPAPDTDASVHPVAPSTPLPAAVEHPSRIPRSQSADPDKAARLSRVFTQSATSVGISGTETPSASASATEDDSSVNTSHEHRERKKRSKSAARIKERVSRKVQVADFEMMRVLGKGCAGKVLLVRHKNSSDLYALKAITKRHVLAHQELQHTLTEQAVLRRMAAEGTDPFVVKLWWSFHDKENLFLVMDFHPGGDLATQLARWGRLGRDRARFYAAEIVEGVEGLHAAGVVYRDLKPENILIAADGHIVLTDFGLSKEFPKPGGQHVAPSTPPAAGSPYWMKDDKELAAQWPSRHVDTTSTFCGTAEYLAPEVIQGLPYSYEVDWWSFGTMLYEMLTGITPFWADNHSDMYVRVLQDELQFPDDRALDQDTKGLIRGLLQRNPALRISEPRIKRHPYFSMIDWAHVYYKRYIPPYIPPIDPSNASDTQNFDDTFLDMEPVINDENDMDTDQERERDQTDLEPTDGEDSVATPSQSRSSSAHPPDDLVDVFDGYSFKGRHSVIIDDEEEVSEEGEEEEEENVTGPGILAELNGEAAAATVVLGREEPIPEPKTPEARPTALPPSTPPTQQSPVSTRPELPPVDTSAKPASFTDATPRASEDAPGPAPSVPISPLKAVASAAAAASTGPDIHHKEPKKAPVSKPHGQRSSRQQRSRREKSGVPALDRDLSDANEEDDVRTERDDDDEWDFIEADGEERNGARGTSLFARGVVDRYRLAVFRKGSTPNRTTPSDAARLSAAATTNGSSSPSPTAKDRRGRTGALPFGRKTFLRAKSPPSTSTRSSRSAGKSFTTTSERSVSATVSTVSSPQSARTTLAQPSLRSKESAVSVGSPGSSSGASTNGEGRAASDPDIVETVRAPQAEEHDSKHKNKKLKRGAEKMLSLFALP